MKNRITKFTALIAILCVLTMAFAVQLASAASYSKVYGQTQEKVRVRQSASTSAAITDNIVKGACVYVTSSKTSGGNTFVQAKYRALDGDIVTGWICQNDGSDTYVKILSNSQAESLFSVKNGNLPSKKVGTFTDSQREAAAKAGGTGSQDSETIKEAQTKLKALGFYSGEITGNAGSKTVAAIKAFQSKYGLTVDGIAGSATMSKINSVYGSGGSSSATSSTTISDVQIMLKDMGLYYGEITGNAGTKTVAAIEAFQKKYGLTVDGVAGSATLSKMKSVYGTGSSSSSSNKNTYLELNSQGLRVSQLQTDLKALGYYSADITGNFGEKTKAAVAKFQSAKGLTADGVAGPSTLDAIDKAMKGSSSDSVQLGSKNSTVSALQKDLAALGYYYGDITGNFGSLTETAVKKFQKAKGLHADGVAGADTLNAIAAALGGSGALSSSGVSATSLRRDDKGPAVTDLQTRLKELGYYYGEITGSFGAITERAVRKFQDDNDLSIDGIAGTKTLNLIYSKTGGGGVSADGHTTLDLYGQMNTDDIPLRKSYSASSAKVTTLDDNDLVHITKSYNNDGTVWYYVQVNKSTGTYSGYVRSMRVDLIDKDDYEDAGGNVTVDYDSVLGMIKVDDSSASLRSGPGKSYEKVDTVYKGEVFYYVDSYVEGSTGWFQISSGYWIKKDDVEVINPADYDDYISSDIDLTRTYRKGDSGTTVRWIQQVLKDLGYYKGELTGTYGNKTHDAVQDFQRDNDLSGDGIAGPKTLAAIRDAEEDEVDDVESSESMPDNGKVAYNVSWFDSIEDHWFTNHGFKKGGYAYLTDIVTGKTMKIKIQSMGNHFDAEPATKDDTEVLCSLYGVSDADQLVTKNKYGRRAMLITTKEGHSVICSIYAIPHGDDTVSGNSYDGQFCLHTRDSKTHGTEREDNDKYGHQYTINAGVEHLEDDGYTIVKVN